MKSESFRAGQPEPGPEAWRDDAPSPPGETPLEGPTRPGRTNPNPEEQSRLLDLLGQINYRILSGDALYIQVRGIIYRILYSVYWRSVFTSVEHYLLRCEEIKDGMWIEGTTAVHQVDLPVRYTKNSWVVEDHSLRFLLYRDSTILKEGATLSGDEEETAEMFFPEQLRRPFL